MLVVSLIFIVLTVIALETRYKINVNGQTQQKRKCYNIASVLSWVFGITACMLIYLDDRSEFVVFKLIIFSLIFLISFFHREEGRLYNVLAVAGMIAICTTAMVGGIRYYESNIESTDSAEEVVGSIELACAPDTYITSGEIRGVLGANGVIATDSAFSYYTPNSEGGFSSGFVEREVTDVYYIDENEKAHLDKIETVIYKTNHNFGLERVQREVIETRYQLYVPEGSIISSFELVTS